jgi:hypothetical protein
VKYASRCGSTERYGRVVECVAALPCRSAIIDGEVIVQDENDSTAMWPKENRKAVKLGTISITALEPNAVCDEKTTDPVVNLPEGVAGPANDPMFEIQLARLCHLPVPHNLRTSGA